MQDAADYELLVDISNALGGDALRHGLQIKVGDRGTLPTLKAACFNPILRYPGIARIAGCGEVPDRRLWIATETVSGVSLSESLAKHSLSVEAVLALIHDVAGVLAYAHRRDVVHRTLTTRSIMLKPRDTRHPVCISGWTDYIIESENGATSVFTSPEQACGGPVDGRADVYALGVIAFQALTGGFPPSSGAVVVPGAPALTVLIAKMLAVDPRLRLTAKVAAARAAKLLEQAAETLHDPHCGRQVVDPDATYRDRPLCRSFAKPKWASAIDVVVAEQIISGEIDTDRSRLRTTGRIDVATYASAPQ